VQLGVGYSAEKKTGKPLSAGSNLEFLWVFVHHDPSERVAPPTTQRFGIERVHNRLFPFKTHAWSVEPWCSLSHNAGSVVCNRLWQTLPVSQDGALPAAVQ